jgi:GxxExxY protein
LKVTKVYHHEEHEDHEGSNVLTRITSSLPESVERLVTETVDAAMAVHRELGPGFLERIYKEALCIELTARSIPYEREVPVAVTYRGVSINGQRLDLVVDGCVVVELKAVTKVDPIHEAKVISYLKTAGLRVGLLMNFHTRLLKDGIDRIVV